MATLFLVSHMGTWEQREMVGESSPGEVSYVQVGRCLLLASPRPSAGFFVARSALAPLKVPSQPCTGCEDSGLTHAPLIVSRGFSC
eukprot:1678199-Alexandrium_andersonii.AAC.1